MLFATHFLFSPHFLYFFTFSPFQQLIFPWLTFSLTSTANGKLQHWPTRTFHAPGPRPAAEKPVPVHWQHPGRQPPLGTAHNPSEAVAECQTLHGQHDSRGNAGSAAKWRQRGSKHFLLLPTDRCFQASVRKCWGWEGIKWMAFGWEGECDKLVRFSLDLPPFEANVSPLGHAHFSYLHTCGPNGPKIFMH